MSQTAPVWDTSSSPTTGQTPSTNLVELSNYYVERLIYQYADQTNAQRLTALMVKQALADDIFTAIELAYNIDTAVGPQLDVIGKYVGVPRNINPVSPSPYFFGFVNYSGGGNTNGFRNYAQNTNLQGIWETYASSIAFKTDLTDIQYRLVIQLQIILNYCDNTLASIEKLLNLILPGFVTLTDNQNMTLTYLISSDAPIGSALLTEFLPAPMGVGINVIVISTGSTRVTSAGYTRVTSTGGIRVTSVGT